MAIELTNPMSGDAFKAEIEKAFDRTTGGVINGKIYKENEEPGSEYITRQAIDNIIYCLNNSTITLKRDENGKIMKGEYKDPNYNLTDCVPWGETSAKVRLEHGVQYTYKNIYNFDTSKPPLGYKSPMRIITITLNCIYGNKVLNNDYKPALHFIEATIKDQTGNIVKSNIFSNGIYQGSFTPQYSFNIDDLDGQYTLEISVSNNIDEINNSGYTASYFTLQIDSIIETAYLRDIVKY